MKIDYNAIKEIEKVEFDKKLIEAEIETDKEAYANKIRNGLGDEIKNGLITINKPIKYKIPFKVKLKNFVNKLCSVIDLSKKNNPHLD